MDVHNFGMHAFHQQMELQRIERDAVYHHRNPEINSVRVFDSA